MLLKIVVRLWLWTFFAERKWQCNLDLQSKRISLDLDSGLSVGHDIESKLMKTYSRYSKNEIEEEPML